MGSTCRPYSSRFRTHMRDIFVPAWSSSVPPPDSALARSIQSTLGAPPKSPEEPGSVFGDRAHVDQVGETRTAESVVGIELLSKIVDNWRTHIGETKIKRPVDVLLEWEGCEARLRGMVAPVLIMWVQFTIWLAGANAIRVDTERTTRPFRLNVLNTYFPRCRGTS